MQDNSQKRIERHKTRLARVFVELPHLKLKTPLGLLNFISKSEVQLYQI
jgi:hypothetical protein